MKREENTHVKSRVPLWRMLDFFTSMFAALALLQLDRTSKAGI